MDRNDKPTVVLAFSGGLDTSWCAAWLSGEMKMNVHSVVVNTGGFSSEELAGIEERARKLGVVQHVAIDAQEEFYDRCIRYLIYGNVLRNHTYPLSVSAERLFQAVRIAEYARDIGADYVAHGSTGAGNDQVRFDMIFQVLCPDARILTPIRDQKLTRRETTEYLQKQGVEIEWSRSKYSINKGLWGTSVGGEETLTSHLPLPEDAWPTQVTAEEPQTISLHFEKGAISGINGVAMSPVEAIRELDRIASPFGIGRDVHVGDTIIGIKGRVGFEAAAPLLLIKAHQLLEKHTLTKWQLYWKDQLGAWYGGFVHEALSQEPVLRDMEAFMEHSQERVTGEVEIELHPRRFVLNGVRSPYDLMNAGFGQYGEMNNAWSGEDVKGFTKIMANSLKVYESVGRAQENSGKE